MVVQAPERVEGVPVEVQAEIVTQREAGMTLAELRKAHPELTSEQIRDVLPPVTKREAEQRTARAKPKSAAQAAKSAKPVGGKAKSNETTEPTPKAAEAKEQRYVDDAELTAQVLAARKLLGRAKLAEVVGATQSSIWRAENDRAYPTEVDALRLALKKIDAGEVEVPTRTPRAKALSKADLLAQRDQLAHLVATARESKSVGTIHELLGKALDILNPTDAPKA
jgi:uncharacterized protein (DUF433 family)